MPFRDIIGHKQLVRLLARSIRRDSVPPSLIFAGPAGIGKRLTAVATAQTLNCLSPVLDAAAEARPPDKPGRRGSKRDRDTALPTLETQSVAAAAIDIDACGSCRQCRRIARGVHSDVLIVEPGDTGSIKTEQVREVIDRASYRPFEGKRRVVIIDDADALVASAQNALLKTLEEPTPSSMFVLVSAKADALLPTVLSRCPRLRFRPLGLKDLAQALVKQGMTEQEAVAVAASAEGSLGRALAMNAGDVVGARDVAERVLAGAARIDSRRRLEGTRDLLENIAGGGAADRERLASHLRAMASLLRDMELLSVGADQNALANADVPDSLEPLARAYRGGRGVRAFAAIDQALVALQGNAGVKIVADWVMLQL